MDRIYWSLIELIGPLIELIGPLIELFHFLVENTQNFCCPLIELIVPLIELIGSLIELILFDPRIRSLSTNLMKHIAVHYGRGGSHENSSTT